MVSGAQLVNFQAVQQGTVEWGVWGGIALFYQFYFVVVQINGKEHEKHPFIENCPDCGLHNLDHVSV